VKILVNGQEKEAERVPVCQAGEPWGESLLADGTLIRSRLLILGVYRIVGEFNALGVPMYQVESTTIVNVIPGTGCGPT
jgi:hypothetical protein